MRFLVTSRHCSGTYRLILRHRWLDFTQAGPRNLFWVLCFGPMSVQMMFWIWWRRKMEKRKTQI